MVYGGSTFNNSWPADYYSPYYVTQNNYVLMLFGNAKAQQFAPAMYWLGWAFTLYQFGSRIVIH